VSRSSKVTPTRPLKNCPSAAGPAARQAAETRRDAATPLRSAAQHHGCRRGGACGSTVIEELRAAGVAEVAAAVKVAALEALLDVGVDVDVVEPVGRQGLGLGLPRTHSVSTLGRPRE
jgi:hypothetical protein